MFIGVDIGGSKILVVAGSSRDGIIRQQKVETPTSGAEGAKELIRLIEAVAETEPIRAIGVASAGVLDLAEGSIEISANMHGWRGTKLVEPLQQAFNVPVALANDAEAAAMTEYEIGAGQKQPYMLYVTISTGIGASLLVHGKTYRGAKGMEAGHIVIDPDGPECGCGGKGHFESWCSGIAIKKRYGKYGYEIKDPAIWDEIAAKMALGIHSLIVTTSPSIVVIGGGVGVHFDQFGDFLLKHLQATPPMFELPEIVQAKYVETAVSLGAIILAERLV